MGILPTSGMLAGSNSAVKITASTVKKMGLPCAGVAVYQLPGANALALAEALQDKMVELAELFPTGIVYDILSIPPHLLRRPSTKST